MRYLLGKTRYLFKITGGAIVFQCSTYTCTSSLCITQLFAFHNQSYNETKRNGMIDTLVSQVLPTKIEYPCMHVSIIIILYAGVYVGMGIIELSYMICCTHRESALVIANSILDLGLYTDTITKLNTISC